jgi:hypothetical protein
MMRGTMGDSLNKISAELTLVRFQAGSLEVDAGLWRWVAANAQLVKG